jgi:hypothetical protein
MGVSPPEQNMINQDDETELERQEAMQSIAAELRELRQLKEVRSKLGDEGLAALQRIVKQIIRRDNGQALRMRSMLLSLFGQGKVALSEVDYFDLKLRKDLCAIILGLNHGRFADYQIREMFIAEGDKDARWFFSGAIDTEHSESTAVQD